MRYDHDGCLTAKTNNGSTPYDAVLFLAGHARLYGATHPMSRNKSANVRFRRDWPSALICRQDILGDPRPRESYLGDQSSGALEFHRRPATWV